MLDRMIGVVFAATLAMAQTPCPAYPATLQNSTIADAIEVMQDFDAVRNCVNNNPVPAIWQPDHRRHRECADAGGHRDHGARP